MDLRSSLITLGNSSLPSYAVSGTESTIYAGQPTLWLERPSQFCQIDQNGNLRSWVDRSSGRQYVPYAQAKPALINVNHSSVLRFGFENNQVNEQLISLDGANDFTPGGSFTFAAIVRYPVSGGSEMGSGNNSGGAFLGNLGQTNYLVFGKSYGAANLNWQDDGSGASTTSLGDGFAGAESATTAFYTMITFDSATKALQLFNNGSQVNSTTDTIGIVSEAGAGQLMIGGTKNAVTDVSNVCVSAIMVFTQSLGISANSALKTAVDTWMTSLLTAVNS